MGRINSALFTSNKQDWTTPIELFNELNKEFDFDCDLFASEENTLCYKYFTQQNSALLNRWCERNFANPPYETKIQNESFRLAHLNAIRGRVTVMLVPARTDTKRFHDFVFKQGYEIRFLEGRLKYGRTCWKN